MQPENLSLNAPAHGKYVALMLKNNPISVNPYACAAIITRSQILQDTRGQKATSLKKLRVLTLDLPSMVSVTEEIVQRRHKKSNAL
jgi:hypothetical protein